MLSGYASQVHEYDYWVPESMIEGAIPKELTGTLFRNGPGLVNVFGKVLDQPFDGEHARLHVPLQKRSSCCGTADRRLCLIQVMAWSISSAFETVGYTTRIGGSFGPHAPQ